MLNAFSPVGHLCVFSRKMSFFKKEKKKRVALLFVFAIELYELFTLWDSAAAAAAKSHQSCPAPYQIHDLQIFSPIL